MHRSLINVNLVIIYSDRLYFFMILNSLDVCFLLYLLVEMFLFTYDFHIWWWHIACPCEDLFHSDDRLSFPLMSSWFQVWLTKDFSN